MDMQQNDSTPSEPSSSLSDWAHVMESLRALITPFLRHFTLDELDQLRFMKSDDDNSIRRFFDCNTVCHDLDGLRMTTKGLFFGASPLGVQLTSDQSVAWKTLPLAHNLFAENPYIWGLTEKSEWVLIRIRVRPVPLGRSRPRVDQIQFSRSDPLTILTTTKDDPRQAYTLLRNAVDNWIGKHEEELQAFDRFKKQVEVNVAASDRLK